MCLNVIVKPRQGGGPGPLGAVELLEKKCKEWTYIFHMMRENCITSNETAGTCSYTSALCVHRYNRIDRIYNR
jgi:hypothetical protein